MSTQTQNLTALADDIVAEVNKQTFMAGNQATTAFAPLGDLKGLAAITVPTVQFVPNMGKETREKASVTFDGEYSVICEVYQYVGLPLSAADDKLRALLLLTDQIADFLKGNSSGALVFAVPGFKEFQAVLQEFSAGYDHMLLMQQGVFVHQSTFKFTVIV